MAIDHLFNGDPFYLVVCKILSPQLEYAMLINNAANIQAIINAFKKDRVFAAVSGGQAKIDVDARTVSCYRASGLKLRTRTGDAAKLQDMIFIKD